MAQLCHAACGPRRPLPDSSPLFQRCQACFFVHILLCGWQGTVSCLFQPPPQRLSLLRCACALAALRLAGRTAGGSFCSRHLCGRYRGSAPEAEGARSCAAAGRGLQGGVGALVLAQGWRSAWLGSWMVMAVSAPDAAGANPALDKTGAGTPSS